MKLTIALQNEMKAEIDKNGNIVGEPIIGADVDGYKKFVEDYLNGK